MDGFPDAPTNISAVRLATTAETGPVEVTWEPGGTEAFRWGLTVNGFPAGMVDGSARSAVIEDIPFGEEVEIGVVGFNSEGGIGDRQASLSRPVSPRCVAKPFWAAGRRVLVRVA